ncbi:hypothetical protein ODZ84_17900 [Chryseobacterium fluminis]|uniref:hypothetical protein n=1 Tax=Chryseobacterium fluminis TaxID=2983606 RepID=UPI002256E19D|nr:hypothetical protein [Chryseobacterium sp. MMS21-Ot14]UZT97057.1 hypothetical protein ODZ84_17900 [Chryseobacterium sp. MMS21-Ot14]
MKTRVILFALLFCVTSPIFAQNKAVLTVKNYITTDITIFIESYDDKGKLKVNESKMVAKATTTTTNSDPLIKSVTPSELAITTLAYKGGNIKIKYSPSESNVKYNLDPIAIPNSKNDVNQIISLSGLQLYNGTENKERLLSIGTNLKFDSKTELIRLIDVEKQLGGLVIGSMENGKLVIRDIIPLKSLSIIYSQPSVLKESSVTDKSTVSSLKVSIPIYGSVEALMSNSDLHHVKWDISYYPVMSNTSFSELINDLDNNGKKALVNKLKLQKSSDKIYLLRNFDVIESGIFSVTSGVKINTEGNAAIASVFTANAAYAFRSEDSKYISIPNKAYNLKYEEWLSINDLVNVINPPTTSQPILPSENSSNLKSLLPIFSNK